MSTLQDAIEAIQDKALALPDVRVAPDYAPEQAPAFPFVVAYASHGDFDKLQTRKVGYSTVIVEIHCDKTPGQERAIQKAMPFHDLFPNALLSDCTFSDAGLEATYLVSRGEGGPPPIRWNFGALGWGDLQNPVETVGFRFEVDIKQVSSIS